LVAATATQHVDLTPRNPGPPCGAGSPPAPGLYSLHCTRRRGVHLLVLVVQRWNGTPRPTSRVQNRPAASRRWQSATPAAGSTRTLLQTAKLICITSTFFFLGLEVKREASSFERSPLRSSTTNRNILISFKINKRVSFQSYKT